MKTLLNYLGTALVRPNSEKGQITSVAIKLLTAIFAAIDFYKGNGNFDLIAIAGYTADFITNLISQQKSDKK